MKRLCTICARGGSKGIPGKNIRLLAGLPLIAHSIKHAKDSGLFELVAVSSDSDEILEIALQHGADRPIKRPGDMATDTAGKIPVIAHALQSIEQEEHTQYDVLVDLDATSPLRSAEDIKGAVALLEENQYSNVITGATAHRSPYFNLIECDESGRAQLSKSLPEDIVRRQDSPSCYDMNASIYVWNRDRFLADPRLFYDDTRLYEMPRNRSLDIDEEIDFAIVELIMAQREQA